MSIAIGQQDRNSFSGVRSSIAVAVTESQRYAFNSFLKHRKRAPIGDLKFPGAWGSWKHWNFDREPYVVDHREELCDLSCRVVHREQQSSISEAPGRDLRERPRRSLDVHIRIRSFPVQRRYHRWRRAFIPHPHAQAHRFAVAGPRRPEHFEISQRQDGSRTDANFVFAAIQFEPKPAFGIRALRCPSQLAVAQANHRYELRLVGWIVAAGRDP